MLAPLFIEKYKSDVIEATKGTGIFPSVKMAQMALESGWGESFIENNAFGIKAKGPYSPYWKGATVYKMTREVENGQSEMVNEPFRKYKSVADSIKDHTYFLQQNPTYTKNGVFTAKTPEEQAKALQRAGYATAPNYADTLISIIHKYELQDMVVDFVKKNKTLLIVGASLMITSIISIIYITRTKLK